MRFASSRSAAPTYWRCTCGGTLSCGSGCIGAGATRTRRRQRICCRVTRPKRVVMSESGPVLVVAPNWLGDAVMALPAIADLKRHFATGPLIVAARPAVSSLFGIAPTVDRVVHAETAAIRQATQIGRGGVWTP